MCTVSYLPLPGGGYILTSNRDETPRRNASEIRRMDTGNQTLLFPVDPSAGGSWFCISDHGKVACLLNGAFVPFTPDPRYTRSRGKVLIDAMQHPSPQDFAARYDLSSTAPFTLVLLQDDALYEMIWDGNALSWKIQNSAEPGFWSSVTLYPDDVRKWRKSLFHQWIASRPVFDQQEIMHFHKYGSKDDPWNGFVMNRNERVKTLSITSVQKQARQMVLLHSDLISGELCTETIELVSADVAEN